MQPVWYCPRCETGVTFIFPKGSAVPVLAGAPWCPLCLGGYLYAYKSAVELDRPVRRTAEVRSLGDHDVITSRIVDLAAPSSAPRSGYR